MEKKKQVFDVRKITLIAILSAISVVLGLTPLGYIPIPPLNPTIMHIPVIIGSIAGGPVVGAMVGLIFGLSSILKAIIEPSPISFVFLNPLVSVLPRILIGITSYYAFRLIKLFRFKNNIISISVGAFIGSITNTILVLGSIYFIYLNKYAQAINIEPSTLKTIFLGVVFSNGVPEAILSVLICVPIIKIYQKQKPMNIE
jgi:uncharacterized membrane protein